MKFTIEDFDVTVQAGRPQIHYIRGSDNQYRVVHFYAPEALIHPAFKKEFEEYVLNSFKMHNNKVKLTGRLPNGDHVSNYIPPAAIRSSYSAYAFRKKIEGRVGDIEEAIEAWDYNKAPVNCVKSGKFGDLKAFIENRAGRQLNMSGED